MNFRKALVKNASRGAVCFFSSSVVQYELQRPRVALKDVDRKLN